MKKRGYLIPDNPEPETDVCVRVYIPNDPLYIAAFWGGYEHFTSWNAWMRDELKRGAVAASRWKQAFVRARNEWLCADGECGIMDVRQNDAVPCELEKRASCGDEWVRFAVLGDCVPKMRLVGSGSGLVLEQLTSGGWISAAGDIGPYEDRFDGPYVPAWSDPPVGQTGNCLATANAVAYTSWALDEIAGKMLSGINILGVISTVVGIVVSFAEFNWVGAIADGYLEVFEFLGDIWQDVIDYFIDGELGVFLVCLYEPDGSMTRENWQDVIDEITAYRATLTDDYKRIKWQLVKLYFLALGPVGMSRIASAAGIREADCGETDCGWFVEFDFTVSDWGFVPLNLHGYDCGVWQEGVGWRGIYAGTLGSTGSFRVYMDSPIRADAAYTRGLIDIEYEDSESGYRMYQLRMRLDGVNQASLLVGDGYYPNQPLSGVYTGYADVTGDQARVDVEGIRSSSPQPDQGSVGGVTLKRLKLWGSGDNPWE